MNLGELLDAYVMKMQMTTDPIYEVAAAVYNVNRGKGQKSLTAKDLNPYRAMDRAEPKPIPGGFAALKAMFGDGTPYRKKPPRIRGADDTGAAGSGAEGSAICGGGGAPGVEVEVAPEHVSGAGEGA